MSVRSAAAAGAATRSTWQARPLCGAQWRDVRRAASTARAVGAKSVAVHGVQLWLNISDGQKPAAGVQQAASSSRPRRSTMASAPEPEASSGFGAGLNARQRRLARRRLEQQLQVNQARLAGCKLRAVLLRALKYVRWSRMQSILVHLDSMAARRIGRAGGAAPRGADVYARAVLARMDEPRCHSRHWAAGSSLGA